MMRLFALKRCLSCMIVAPLLGVCLFLSAPFAAEPAPQSDKPAATAEKSPAPAAAAPQSPPASDDAKASADSLTDPIDYAARAAEAQKHIDALPEEVADDALRSRVAEQWKEALAQWQKAAQAAEQFARRRQNVEGVAARLQVIQGENDALRDKAASADDQDASHSLADLESELREIDLNLPEWTKQMGQRQAHMEGLPQRLVESRQAADAAQARLAEKDAPLPDSTPPELMAAAREARLARQRADHEIVAGSEYYRNIQEPLAQLDAAERDLLSRRIEFGKARREQLSERIADRRRVEAEAIRRESETAAARFLEALPPSFRVVADDNRKLSAALDQILEREKELNRYQQGMTGYIQSLQTDFDHIRVQLESGSGSQTLGSYLWAKRRSLQREVYQAGKSRDKFATAAVPDLTLGSMDEMRRRIPRLEKELASFASGPDVADLPENLRAELLNRAKTLLENNSKLVASLSESIQRQSAALMDMEASNRELRAVSGKYTALVDRYVLHLPGSAPLWRISVPKTLSLAWKELSRANIWKDTGLALLYGLLRSPWLILFLVLSIAPTAVQRALAGWLKSLNIAARTPVAASPRGLLWRAGRAIFRSYPAPLALFTVGAAIWSAANPGSDAAAVGEALSAAVLPWLLLNIWRHFCEADGMFELYAHMPRPIADRLYRRLGAILYIGLPLWIIVWFVQNRTEPPEFQAFGGMVSLSLAVLAVCFWWLRMRPAVFLRGAETRSRFFWQLLHMIVMALGLLWVVMSLLGYNYGALLVISKAVSSGLIVTFIALVARYWSLQLARSRERQRARAILYYRFSEERRRQREKRNRETPVDGTAQNGAAVDGAGLPPEDDELHLIDSEEVDHLSSPAVAAAAVSIPPNVEKELDESLASARQLVWWLSLATGAIVLLMQWSDLFPVQEWLGRLTLLSRPDATGLTLRDVAKALVGGGICYAVAKPLGAWANLSFFGWNPSERGARVATAALIRYAMFGVGVIWVAQELGMAWSDAQWLVAALGVGLGFGLQEIILNFVSGIILLFERPVRVGDMVTIGGTDGTITRIDIRTTTLMDADRRELIIPNKELVTGRVTNWTLTDSVTRVVIPVSVAYGSNLELVQRLLKDAADCINAVLDDPAPSVYFVSMSESSLNFDLRVYTGRLEDRMPVQHQLRLNINRLFRRHGIAIPFPQMDVHIKSDRAGEKP